VKLSFCEALGNGVCKVRNRLIGDFLMFCAKRKLNAKALSQTPSFYTVNAKRRQDDAVKLTKRLSRASRQL
jgi:hypothetical protein